MDDKAPLWVHPVTMLRIADIAPLDREDSSAPARPGRRRAQPVPPNSAPKPLEILAFPRWARFTAAAAGSAEAGFAAGAGLALLDRVLRAEPAYQRVDEVIPT